MKRPLIVVDHLEEWEPFAVGADVAAAGDYLLGAGSHDAGGRVINLCRDGSYLSTGYYVSLLAEARGRRALPSVRTQLELSSNAATDRVRVRRPAALRDRELSESLAVFFGRAADDAMAGIASAVFNRYPAPILTADVSTDGDWLIARGIRPKPFAELSDDEQTDFGDSLDHFSQRVWRAERHRRTQYDLAILTDDEEKLPPSNRGAIRRFEKAARAAGFLPEVIQPADAIRLLEFDALFIRCTTGINHFTYPLALQAAREGLAVIDDPDSILRCCNKVFLHDLLASHRIPMPATRVLVAASPPDLDQLVEDLGLPIVLKIPDGSFSRGVFKADDRQELEARVAELLSSSAVILAQAFVKTSFDWRIGVLEGRALYACRYRMARKHWQIIDNSRPDSPRSGDAEGVPLSRVPGAVVRAAVRAAKLIGDGLYGVDVKEVDGRPLIIEVNDNPTIDAGFEDQMLGDELYRQVIGHLHAQLQKRGR